MPRRLIYILTGFLILLSGGLTTVVEGQTLFARPDTTPDFSRYTNADECVVAASRLIQADIRERELWADTAIHDPTRRTQPPPDTARNVLRVCMDKFSFADMADAPNELIMAYLLAGQGEKALEVVHMEFARLIDSGATGEVLSDRFLSTLQSVRGMVHVDMDFINDMYVLGTSYIPADSLLQTVGLHALVMTIAKDVGDSAFAWQAALNAKDAYERGEDNLPTSQELANMVKVIYVSVLDHLGRNSMMDSLAVSTESYRNAKNNIWRIVMKDSTVELPDQVGHAVTSLEGDFWYEATGFNKDGGATNYSSISPRVVPTPGRNTVVTSLQGCHTYTTRVDAGRHNGRNPGCFSRAATMKRLKRDFPEVDFIIITGTYGVVGQAPPLSEPEEADTLAKYYLSFLEMPVTLVVGKTPSIRLEEPDRRRVDLPLPALESFQADGKPVLGIGTTAIIDSEGKVVMNGGQITPRYEDDIRRLLTALRRQNSE